MTSDIRGIDPVALEEHELFRELLSLYRTRMDTLRHGSHDALQEHNHRMQRLEDEYLRRRPEREVDPLRLRNH
jgi:uncharacterized protein DUF6158